jgi:transposase-like protein
MLIRTTNGVERSQYEIRRRASVVSISSNLDSSLRLVLAVLAEVSDERLTGRTYLTFQAKEKIVPFCPKYVLDQIY